MILFLDIDGVLHPEPATVKQAFCCRHLLWEILLGQPALQVVISSDWRINHSLDYLIEKVTDGSPADLKHRFVGVTPFLPEAKHVYRDPSSGSDRPTAAEITFPPKRTIDCATGMLSAFYSSGTTENASLSSFISKKQTTKVIK